MMIKHQKSPQFKLEISEKIPAITSFAGLGLLREALHKLGLIEEMKKFLLKRAGYGDDIILEALILLLAAGGRCLSDWEYLKGELGFENMFGECPSVDTLERYLRKLEIEVPGRESEAGQAGYTSSLEKLHQIMLKKCYRLAGTPNKLTLDLDAMLIETDKSEALYSYEKTKAYHPMNVYCPELRMILAHEFRDGNVSPAEGYQRLVKRCIELLPGVHFTVRSDSAGYQNDFMDWMTLEKIRFYITADQTESLKASILAAKEWEPLILNKIDTGSEVTSLLYGASATTLEEQKFRIHTRNYIAIRKEKEQLELFDKYIYQVIVTNALWEKTEEVIKNHRGRCGSIEYANQQVKSQCGMDMMPSNDFSVNAAWYSLGCLTHNLLRFVQEHLLPER
jgi:hypothetical protein